MAFVITDKKYEINDLVVLKDEKGEELYKFSLQLTEDDIDYIAELLEQSQKDITITEEDEEKLRKIVFKDNYKAVKEKISKRKMAKIVLYASGLVVNYLGLEQMNTMTYATSRLQKKLKK